jgi:hypothetical protein
MNTQARICVAICAVVALGAQLPAGIAAAEDLAMNPGEDVAQAPNGEGKLAGSWTQRVTLRSCATGAALRTTYPAHYTYFGDHSAIESTSGIGAGLRTISHGRWQRTGKQSYLYRSEFFIFDAAGTYVSRQVTERAIEVASDGNHLAVTGRFYRYTPDGVLTSSNCLTEEGDRLAEPAGP